MRYFFFIFFLTSTLQAASCPQGEKGAMDTYMEEEQVEKESLEVDRLKSSTHELYRVTNMDTCSTQGCNFSLYIADKENCLVEAFNVSNAKVSKSETDWTRFTILVKTIGIDGAQTYKKTYTLNPERLKFEEKKLR